MKANVFILGACKSGTSYLHDLVASQKDVCGSKPKEPYYYEMPCQQRNPEEYFSKYFSHYEDEELLVDGRHRNMFFSWCPEEIVKYNPKAKAIIILRDPLSRAYSHWWMWYSRKVIRQGFSKTIHEEYKSFERKESPLFFNSGDEYIEAVRDNKNIERMAYADANTIVDSGMYAMMLDRIFEHFSKKNVLILDFNRLNDQEYLNKRIQPFLGMTLADRLEKKSNKNAAKNYVKTESHLSRFLPRSLKDYLKKKFLSKPEMKTKDKMFLKGIYQDSNKELIDKYQLDFVENW